MDASKLHARAEEAIKKENFDYAIDLLKTQILSIYPDDVKARQLLRGCVQAKHKKQGAPSALSAQAAALVPQIKVVIGKMTKKWDNVMQECENILLHDPRNKGALYSLADAAARAGYVQTAISQHEACLKIDPGFKDSLRSLGHLYESQDELQKALEYFQQITRVDGTDGDAARKVKEISAKMTSATYDANRGKHSRNLQKDADKGEELELEEKQLRSKEDFLKVIAIEEKKLAEGADHPERQYRKIGDLYKRMGDFKKAIASLEKALEINPTSFDTTVLLGDCKIAQLESRVKKYTKAAKEGDSDAKSKLKSATKKLNELKVAEYTRRVEEHPTDPDKRYFLGQVLIEIDRPADAIEHLQRGTKSPRYKNQSYNLLGQAFFATGEANLAIKQFEKALEAIEKGDARAKPVQYNLACAYEENGDKENAIRFFELLLEQDVNYRDVKKKLEALRS